MVVDTDADVGACVEQVWIVPGAGVWPWWCRCGKKAGTCTAKQSPMRYGGADPWAKATPAPETHDWPLSQPEGVRGSSPGKPLRGGAKARGLDWNRAQSADSGGGSGGLPPVGNKRKNQPRLVFGGRSPTWGCLRGRSPFNQDEVSVITPTEESRGVPAFFLSG